MNEIILSFKPEFFKALLTGKKHFEYRSRIPEKETVAYLYLSSPAKMIVGKMILGQRNNIQNFLENSDLENSSRPYLENHLQEGAKYFSPIYSLSLLDSPISLKQAKELSPRFNAPQGYSYVTNIKNCIIFLKTLYFQHLRLIHLMFWTY
ncbi:MAG: hypothetical protein ACFNW2_02890 [Streptococcus sanguinis]